MARSKERMANDEWRRSPRDGGGPLANDEWRRSPRDGGGPFADRGRGFVIGSLFIASLFIEYTCIHFALSPRVGLAGSGNVAKRFDFPGTQAAGEVAERKSHHVGITAL